MKNNIQFSFFLRQKMADEIKEMKKTSFLLRKKNGVIWLHNTSSVTCGDSFSLRRSLITTKTSLQPLASPEGDISRRMR